MLIKRGISVFLFFACFLTAVQGQRSTYDTFSREYYIAHNRNLSIWKGNNFPNVYYFAIDRYTLTRNYRNNDIMLHSLDSLLRSPKVVAGVDTIRIIGACSPVGSEEYNRKLGLKRGLALREYMQQKHPKIIERLPVKINVTGIDWFGFNFLSKQPLPFSKKEIWGLLQYTAVVFQMKDGSIILPGEDYPKRYPRFQGEKLRLEDIPDDDKIWGDTIMPVKPDTILRRDTVTFLKRDTITVFVLKRDTVYIGNPRMSVVYPEKAPFFLALKTNLIYDAALLPNLSVEWYMGKKWSIVAGGNWSWWTFDKPVDNLWFHRIQMGEFELRRWFKSDYPLHGHALGVYSFLGNYSVRFLTQNKTSRGELSYQSWSAGLSYAYSIGIAKHFNLEFGLAVGYVGGRYNSYDWCTEHEGGHWAYREIHNRNYIGPTRIGVSIVWLLGTGNDKDNKNKYLLWKQRKNIENLTINGKKVKSPPIGSR